MIEVNGTDEQRAAMFAALSKAQSSVGTATKRSGGQIGNTKYRYANLAAVEEAIGTALEDNDLCILQFPGQYLDGSQQLLNIVTHSSGASIQHLASAPCKNDVQGSGSALSYLRRYSLAAILRIITEDDDGKKAMPRQGGYSAPPYNDASQGSYEATLPFNEEREVLPRNTASGDVNPSTVEALIKNTGFPHKGILGAYLKEKDMLTGYRAEDIAAWLSDNAGASGEELLFAAAAYGAEKLDGEFRDKSEAYAKANPS